MKNAVMKLDIGNTSMYSFKYNATIKIMRLDIGRLSMSCQEYNDRNIMTKRRVIRPVHRTMVHTGWH